MILAHKLQAAMKHEHFANLFLLEITSSGNLTEEHIDSLIDDINLLLPHDEPTEVLADKLEIRPYLNIDEVQAIIIDCSNATKESALALKKEQEDNARLSRELEFYKNQIKASHILDENMSKVLKFERNGSR